MLRSSADSLRLMLFRTIPSATWTYQAGQKNGDLGFLSIGGCSRSDLMFWPYCTSSIHHRVPPTHQAHQVILDPGRYQESPLQNIRPSYFQKPYRIFSKSWFILLFSSPPGNPTFVKCVDSIYFIFVWSGEVVSNFGHPLREKPKPRAGYNTMSSSTWRADVVLYAGEHASAHITHGFMGT